MPRPPRSKVASRVAKPTKPKAAPARKQAAKPIPAQTKKLSEAANSFSEDSDGLVTKSRTTRSRRTLLGEKTPEAQDEAELTMTGALPAEEDIPVSSIKNRTPASNASKRTRATRSSARKSAAHTSPTAIEPTHEESQIEEDSGYGDLTFSSLGSNSPAHGTRPPSAIKVGATPAHERSILALTNFKRRARQPSLLRMVQQTTDVEDNDQDDLDNTDNFDFDDFLPHAESTPLNVRKQVPEEETRNDSGTQISSSGSRGTKRKLSPVVQVPRSSPPVSPQSGGDVESERSHSPSLPEVLPTREEVIAQTQEDDEPLSETLAPPMSSSPEREVSKPPPTPAQTRPRRRGRQAKTPVVDEDSDGEETETPARAKQRAKKKAQQSISTAQLKELLPRRRNRLRDRDEFEIESSDDIEQVDSDQDELQMPTRRVRQRQGAGKPASPKATKKTGRAKKTAPAKPAGKSSRTYGRRISSDKENETADQNEAETTEVSAIEQSEKLAAIRKKFEEVDAFELEFEDVDATTSSSPFR
ncbi:uncharacterized protein J4E92_005751 [Alternaria infectoria]|uniref:uncharacterized protein n=1 Tax=Alternaria viburni TaxID=566460 RepID=UPI0020C2B9BF|nr:uncharacterized protein J4E79_004791 [Alternaria viburni]XP_051352789.1 uncharacterized protein J4E92_005751 [Alternaria infectoria]KAI4662501.1 hypothetical protein J4E79_004791 [Alternaria viburni]KAI4711854.1 hypothetical protein J4E89_003297 [Alternaria sp. Ai002NY15]KAI4928267.1 hypothetical protein J4E92_005751 [Alternaria infectoria]